MLTARRGDRLDQLATELKAVRPGLEILTIAADLADPATPERLLAETIVAIRRARRPDQQRRAGPADSVCRLPIPSTWLASSRSTSWPRSMLTRLCLPSLIERQGMIINIGSAITCVANSALGAYGATKAGLAYWNDALRRELHSKGVTVCLVEPGPIKTEFMDAAELAGARPRNRLIRSWTTPLPG